MNKRFLIVLSFCIIASMAVIHSIAAPDDTNVWGKADNANKEKKEETQAGAQAKKDDSKMTAAERRRQAAAERRKKAEEEKNKSTLEKYREKYPPVLSAKENAFSITREAAQELALSFGG